MDARFIEVRPLVFQWFYPFNSTCRISSSVTRQLFYQWWKKFDSRAITDYWIWPRAFSVLHKKKKKFVPYRDASMKGADSSGNYPVHVCIDLSAWQKRKNQLQPCCTHVPRWLFGWMELSDTHSFPLRWFHARKCINASVDWKNWFHLWNIMQKWCYSWKHHRKV